jgi:multidrug efflux pump subunit AcrB
MQYHSFTRLNSLATPSLKKQQGATFLGMAIVAAGLIFVAIIGMKLMPAYIEYMSVKKVLKAMGNDPSLSSMSTKEVRQSFEKRKSIDDIKSVTKDDIVVSKSEAGTTVVTADYQVQTPLMGNVTALLDFHASSDGK